MFTNEQKTIFAERYLRRPTDALMIVASILGREKCSENPMIPISLAESLPNDEFVRKELERLRTVLPTIEDYVRELHENAKRFLDAGDNTEYVKAMRLIAEMRGMIKRNANEEGKSDDRLKELANMVVGNNG